MCFFYDWQKKINHEELFELPKIYKCSNTCYTVDITRTVIATFTQLYNENYLSNSTKIIKHEHN